ncbi:hypothetical protein RRG08_010097 [Elysia crispata]|uniref:Interleukin 17-like protein n=1 Tax=Elysia crispata TaxID=231223 RepID=A0AAE1A4A9_9GAST|nr:hypothetical protein RRG08_010097 [Elysia crispata]
MFSASMKRMIRLSAAAVLTFLVFDHLPTPACSHAVGVSSPRNSQSGHMALSDAQREHIQGRRSTEFTGRSLRDHVSRAAASSTNPFLRVRRDVPGRSCSTPADLPVQVRELNAFLNNSDYIALMPQQDDSSLLPTGHQHSSCPAATGSWWPGQEVNLRSTCPWVWENLDNGQDAYPRYIRQARCMCLECVGADIHSCHENRLDVTIFRLKGCHDGLAVLEKTAVRVTVSCVCVAQRNNQIDHSFLDA